MYLSLAVTEVTHLCSVSCLPKLASSNKWFSVKVKVFIVHVMNAYGGSGGTAPFILNLSISGMFTCTFRTLYPEARTLSTH